MDVLPEPVTFLSDASSRHESLFRQQSLKKDPEDCPFS